MPRHGLRLFACATALAALLASVAMAQSRPDQPARLSVKLDQKAINDAHPPVALANGIGGTAVLRCEIARDGAAQCVVERESPEAMGFGVAAQQALQGASFNPAYRQGIAEPSVISITVEFVAKAGPALVVPALNVTAIQGAAAPLEEPGQDRYYPHAAHLLNMEGQAVVACVVRSDGRRECGVEREEPSGWGFGEKALHVASLVKLPADKPGEVVRLPVRFGIREPTSDSAASLARSMWSSEPSKEQIDAVYPARASRAGVEGRVALACEVLANGRVACKALAESPSGWGFGKAAENLYSLYKMSADQFGAPGRAVGDKLLLPVTFSLVK